MSKLLGKSDLVSLAEGVFELCLRVDAGDEAEVFAEAVDGVDEAKMGKSRHSMRFGVYVEEFCVRLERKLSRSISR